MTLNNLAVLYRATQRMQQAERAYDEALAIQRRLAEANPDAYLPDVALTLNNLAILTAARSGCRRPRAYDEALGHPARLAEHQPRGLPTRCRHDAEQPGEFVRRDGSG